jgi:hypothetical protein
LLTFNDYFTKYVAAFPITDVSAKICARISATHIIVRHGGGSIIMDQGRPFTSAFFQETCKVLKVRKVGTSALHAISKGIVERFQSPPLLDCSLYRLNRYKLGCGLAIPIDGFLSHTIQYVWVLSFIFTTCSRNGFYQMREN